jgi:SlyX protein
MTDSARWEQRLTELEIQLTHTQRACDQLNEVVTQLSLDAQSRERLIKRMVEQIKDLKGKLDEPGSAADEKPPHY